MTVNSEPTPPPSDSIPQAQRNSPASAPQDSYTKLAMRNMVRKSGQSLRHYGLTVIGLLSLLIGLSYLTR